MLRLILLVVIPGSIASNYRFESIKITDVNPELLTTKGHVDKNNGLNVDISILKDMPPLYVTAQLYGIINDVQTALPIKISRTVCDLFNNEYKWIEQELAKASKIPTSCPILKGDWYIKDFVLSTKNIPFKLTLNRILLKGRVSETSNNKTVAAVDVFIVSG